MGRGRVQLRRIENKIRRQVTFSKRRTGLVKKAQEISVLCDAEVGLIIFSTKGKLFEFSAGSSMEKILDRYERHSYAGNEAVSVDSPTQGSCSAEHSKLMRMVEILHRNMRHLKGEQLDELSIRELQCLEQHIDAALKRIRSGKSQLLHESIAQLQKQEKELKIQNRQLIRKLQENQEMLRDAQDLEQQNLSQNSSGQPPDAQRLSPPSLSLGVSCGRTEAKKGGVQPQAGPPDKQLPHWMRRREEE